MTITWQQQLSAASRSQIESQLSAWSALSAVFLEGVARLSNLNMQALHEAADESAAWSRRLVDTRNPQEYLAVAAEQTQRQVERLASYRQHVTHIASDVRVGFGKVVQEEFVGMNRQTSAAMSGLFGQTAEGAGPFGEWLKVARDAAGAGVEQLVGAVAQMNAALDQKHAMSERPASRARRK